MGAYDYSPRWREDYEGPENALDALDRAIMFVSGAVRNGPGGKPGEVVQRLISASPTFARQIRKLRSDDIREVRDDLFV